ncbi:hypothetical protein LR48_Vigan10g140700 [Vigna angularis]|uniref:Uncharacterized protein n=1 Tax=Phaseolus angularis TaxID=3914 RepID=A0A0L9VKE3_PHAAN|nr:hypothetical protein LR48_Vigan10g140700 [Vigna angularis]
MHTLLQPTLGSTLAAKHGGARRSHGPKHVQELATPSSNKLSRSTHGPWQHAASNTEHPYWRKESKHPAKQLQPTTRVQLGKGSRPMAILEGSSSVERPASTRSSIQARVQHSHLEKRKHEKVVCTHGWRGERKSPGVLENTRSVVMRIEAAAEKERGETHGRDATSVLF